VAVDLIHRSCGESADPYLACAHCHEPLAARDIIAMPRGPLGRAATQRQGRRPRESGR
jgi:hypothetical protein